MGKIKYLALSLIAVGCFYYWARAASSTFQRREFMNIEVAEKKWGSKKFFPEKFKTGDASLRASMVVDLIRSKYFIGKPLKKVRTQLGKSKGYFENDGIEAYLITPSPEKRGSKKEMWQIIFLPDNEWKKVDEVKIHKNCCYN